jgi:putative salt-induced outer membrane protein YdiY
MYRLVFVIIGLIALISAAWSARADEIHLLNGDRLTGEIIRMEKGSLVVKTAYAEEILIVWEQVACIASDKDLKLVMENGEVFMGRALCPEGGKIQITSPEIGQTAAIVLADLEAINPSPPPPVISYKASITGGGNTTSGNTDTTAAYFSGLFQARSRRHRLTMGGKYNYGETDGELTARNALGTVKYDFFLTDKLYSYAHTLFERDDFQDLNLRSTLGLGLGYQIFDTKRTSLFVEAGVSYFNEDYDVAEDDHYTSARESMGFEFQIVPERIRFFHLHELYYSLEESDSYYLRSEQGFRFLLFRNFFANVQVDYNYNRQPAPGRRNYDANTIFGLTYERTF